MGVMLFSANQGFCLIPICLDRRDCDCDLCWLPASDIDRRRNKKYRQRKDGRMKYHLHLIPDPKRFHK